jgi:hypothetical protein
MTNLALAAPLAQSERAKLLALHDAGWGEDSLAAHFQIGLGAVRREISAKTGRQRMARQSAPPRVVDYEIPRETLRKFPAEMGDGLAKFANHEGHVEAVMRAGGFQAWTETRHARRITLSLPFRRPVYPIPERRGQRTGDRP